MPSSRPNAIPTVIHLIRQLKPRSILDVGIGFGKWGHLFREYTDINAAENDPARYQHKNWQVRIDGIEGYPAYLTEMHRYLYTEIHVGDACELIKRLPPYDVVFMGDIIEHLDKQAGFQLLQDAIAKAGKAVIVSTPKYDTAQPNLCGNELERHRSFWTIRDFRRFAGATVKTVDRSILLAVITRPGIAPLRCAPPAPLKPAERRRWDVMKTEIIGLIPTDATFILIDDDQLRSQLPHPHSVPFLEKDGQYWGPPADEQTAIREFERLRTAGAKYLVITWPAFWWLDYYGEFRKHLRSNFHCLLENDRLVVFDLQPRRIPGSPRPPR